MNAATKISLPALLASLAALAAPPVSADDVVVYRATNPDFYYAPRITVRRAYANENALITEEVKDELARDARLDPSRIAVETDRNVVTLSGLVSTPGQARIALQDAHRVEGVHEVRNYLRPRVGWVG
jgi:hypothetical protein